MRKDKEPSAGRLRGTSRVLRNAGGKGIGCNAGPAKYKNIRDSRADPGRYL